MWQRIDDCETAWQLLKAGMLWFGDVTRPHTMTHYHPNDYRTHEYWCGVWEENGFQWPHYVLTEE